jgi:NDP-sugar pyrophosphorylase family protein
MPDATIVAEPQPLGTAGALRFVADRLEDHFLLLNGDSLFDIDLRRLARMAPVNAHATLALRAVPDASRYGAVRLEGAKVVRFEEKSQRRGEGLINGGIAIVAREMIAGLRRDTVCSIERDLYPLAVREGRLAGFVFDGAFIDIGTPEDYLRAQTFVPQALSGRSAPVPSSL